VLAASRIGLIGDIHAEDEHLATALAHFRAARTHVILAVGDIADGPGDLERCISLLAAADVLAIRGNHDRWFLANQLRNLPDAHTTASAATRAYLAALPATRRIPTTAGRLHLCHGLGDNDMARLLPDDTGYALEANTDLHTLLAARHPLVVCGHTHRRMIRTFDTTIVLNPGTLFREHEPGFMVLDTAAANRRDPHVAPPSSMVVPLDHRFP